MKPHLTDARVNTGPPEMPSRLYARLAAYIQRTCGIRMPPEKRVMLQSRLQKRMRRLGHESYEDYVDYVFSPEGTQLELQAMIDVVTTNKTDFFREPYHFEYLARAGLAALPRRAGEPLRVWSAPCSRGHEAYTIAMMLAEHAATQGGPEFEVLGADLSSQALEVARRAVYPHREIEPVPLELRRKYLLRSKGREDDLVRIAPELRARTRFVHLNFLDDTYRLGERGGPGGAKFHVIFCRNMLIYFEPPTQERVVNHLARHLVPGGLLLTGHSETLARLATPFVPVEPTIYRLPA